MSHEDDVFFGTFKGILIFLFVLMIVLIIGANMIVGDDANKSDPINKAAKQENIAPVGEVKIASTMPAPAPADAPAATAAAPAADGKQTYDTACMACHGTGAAGAPKMGDKAAWGPRIAQGMDVLKEHAIKGFKGSTGFMPAKGGRADLSDTAVAAAISYMVENSK